MATSPLSGVDALKTIERRHVEKAMREYDSLGLQEALRRYGDGPSEKHYALWNGRHYDVKLILRMAYAMAYAKVPPKFKSRDARSRLKQLDFELIEDPKK